MGLIEFGLKSLDQTFFYFGYVAFILFCDFNFYFRKIKKRQLNVNQTMIL